MSHNLFIGSLHRPFNNRLITVKWACRFAKGYNGKNFKVDFFIQVIKYLHEVYKEISIINGFPKKETVDCIHYYITNTKNIQNELKKYYKPVPEDSHSIYSTLKATSYYTTLAKKFDLMDSNFLLTLDGQHFANLNRSPKNESSLTPKEINILFKQILKNDFIPIVFGIFYYRLKHKYIIKEEELNEMDSLFLIELDNFLNLREFRLKQSSWSNYVIVRENWIKDLNILSKSYNLKPKFLKIIRNSEENTILYEKISKIMLEFERNFKNLEKYQIFKKEVSLSYKEIKKSMFFKNINYVNMYDLKEKMGLSFNDFEYMINRLASDENNRKKVFFNNIISAVDNRKRFNIKNSPVLNIRIIKDLT
jgi:hypothetical protein